MPRSRWLVLVPVLIWVVAMLFIASRPRDFFLGPQASTLWGVPRGVVQYAYHVGVSFVLAVLAAWGLTAAGLLRGRRTAVAALALILIVSITAKALQSRVRTRSPAVRDVVLDLSGALLGLGVLRMRR